MKLKCSSCKKIKIETSFHRDHSQTHRNLRRSICKICASINMRRTYSKNKVKMKLISMLYKLKYKEYVKSYDAKYRELHEKSLKNYLKDYYTKNKLAYRDYRAVLNTGMAVKTYRELVEKQNKCCAICKKPEKVKYPKSRQVKNLIVNPTKKLNLICHTCRDKLKKKSQSKKVIAQYVTRSASVN